MNMLELIKDHVEVIKAERDHYKKLAEALMQLIKEEEDNALYQKFVEIKTKSLQ